jgi:transketolase
MPIIDSKTNKIIKDLTLKELEKIAKEMRAYSIIAITAAGSGHTGGTMSIIDIATALYFKKIRHDPTNPDWPDRDRVFWSAGHKAPALYAVLGMSGYFNIDDIVLLRKLSSGFEGHPNRFKLPGIEVSSGSLGQGLGVALGSAISTKLNRRKYNVYCILGDGELNEGSVWEAAMSASHHRLDNLIAIVDRNRLQIDGYTSDVMEIEPLIDKWQSFGWQVYECNGHDMEEIMSALNRASSASGKPSVIIANTVKGKDISFAENVCAYHGISPKDGVTGDESLEAALKDIKCSYFTKEKVDKLLKKALAYQGKIDKKIEGIVPKFSTGYFWNETDDMKVMMIPTRMGFGRGIEKAGSDSRVVVLGADITDSIKMSSFYKSNPERKSRFFSMGIAEANMTVVAAGLAKEGFIPFIGSYGVFSTGRNWDQLRTTVCYNNFNVKIIDAHGGISIKELHGPAAIRLAREATPVITKTKSPYKFGIANIIRYREKKRNFIDAFEIYLSTDYKSENEDISVIACGPIVAEAIRAAYIMKEEFGTEVRVVNIHTVKPIDAGAIINAARDTKIIITAEEHQKGGFGNIIAGIISEKKNYRDPYIMDMIGIEDRFGESGRPWELMKLFGLTAEFIAKKAMDLLSIVECRNNVDG